MSVYSVVVYCTLSDACGEMGDVFLFVSVLYFTVVVSLFACGWMYYM